MCYHLRHPFLGSQTFWVKKVSEAGQNWSGQINLHIQIHIWVWFNIRSGSLGEAVFLLSGNQMPSLGNWQSKYHPGNEENKDFCFLLEIHDILRRSSRRYHGVQSRNSHAYLRIPTAGGTNMSARPISILQHVAWYKTCLYLIFPATLVSLEPTLASDWFGSASQALLSCLDLYDGT